jgi:hypothetical protein
MPEAVKSLDAILSGVHPAEPPTDVLGQGQHVASLDRELHRLWGLGRNAILAWTPRARAVEALVIPHYAITEAAAQPTPAGARPRAGGSRAPAKSFIEDVISSPKRMSAKDLKRVARVLGYPTQLIRLSFAPGEQVAFDDIERLVKRYSISYVEDRAVALFDIVGFSLFSPLEQVTQLNSLSYSVNSAYSKMLSKQIDISFARTTTGDGFYVWNRDRSVQANVNLYHFMHLVLADNAIARRKSKSNTTPLLRACFHVGGHYEFYQSEGLNPTMYSYIVGDVTIELARMIERAMPGQVLVGDFMVPMPDASLGQAVKIDSLEFIERTQATLSSLEGLVLSGDAIQSIQCYLTGEKRADDSFAVKRYRITDKHGKSRDVYNAKINIYRSNAEPIFLGVQNKDLHQFRSDAEAFVAAAR